jgi:hypothetical protein
MFSLFCTSINKLCVCFSGNIQREGSEKRQMKRKNWSQNQIITRRTKLADGEWNCFHFISPFVNEKEWLFGKSKLGGRVN